MSAPTQMLRAVRWYATHGLFVFPIWPPAVDAAGTVTGDCTCPPTHPSRDPDTGVCESPGKHPMTPNGHLDATTDVGRIEAWWRAHPTANVGLACGPSQLIVLDVDPRNHGDDELAALLAQEGETLPDTWTVGTSRGGVHHYFRWPAETPDDPLPRFVRNLCPGVEVKGAGGYVVTPKSLHVTGDRYQFLIGAGPTDLPTPAVCPPWLWALVTRAEEAYHGTPSGPVACSLLGVLFEQRGLVRKVLTLAKWAVTCPWEAAHTGGRARSGTVLFGPREPGEPGGFFCAHAHCAARDVRAVMWSFSADEIAAAERTLEERRKGAAANGAEQPSDSTGPGGGSGADPAPPAVEWEEVRPWPTLDPAALFGLAGDVVRVLEPHTEADPAGLLLTFLALFGNAVGDGPHVRVGAIRHPARLFPCLVGATARSRKGQSFGEVGSILELADAVWWAVARAGGLASGEGVIARVRDNDQSTVEKRALFYEPEFARTLAAAGRDGSTLSAVLRDAWDTGRLAVTTRKDPLVATGAHIGVVAHVTLEELRARLTSLDIANGFANRFLFTCVRRSKKLPSGGTLAEAERARLGVRVGAALDVARKRTVVTRTPAAEALWCDVYNQLPEPAGLFGAVTARAEAQLVRLQLEYFLLDQVEQIDVPHLEAAVAAWRYAEASAAHTFGGTLGYDHADRLLEELRAVYPLGLSREAQHTLFGRHLTAAELATARETLVRLGLAEERSEPSPGRHPWMLYALPKQAKKAKEGCQQGLPSLPSQLPEREQGLPSPSQESVAPPPSDAPDDVESF